MAFFFSMKVQFSLWLVVSGLLVRVIEGLLVNYVFMCILLSLDLFYLKDR